jgi:hypothetical protein
MGEDKFEWVENADRVSAPLLGSNLVRLLYLDEAGIDHRATHMCVAGVIVHGDAQWPEVDKRIQALIDMYIPAEDRAGFVFHATDIFHGSAYFDRRKSEWADRERRNAILDDFANIISELALPVVCGNYEKGKFGAAFGLPMETEEQKLDLMQRSALLDCLLQADKWLERFSPTELAIVIHEDIDHHKRLIKFSVREFRSNAIATELGADICERLGLPLKRIIDTVHFAEKADARPLQLADFCAFMIGRAIKGKDVPPHVLHVLLPLIKWARSDQVP